MNEKGRRVEGVSRVVAYIARLIEANKTLRTIAVRGEVSGLSRNSGRLYFSLKEGADLLNCVVWAKEAMRLPTFENGDEIIVDGTFTTFSARSQYQIDVKDVELSGIGKLYQKFEQLRKKFGDEGLFLQERKRPFPRFPERIAVISAKGKGAEDFLTTMERKAPHIRIRFVEATVQGEYAQFEIADALDRASEMDVDVIVLTRGGGSYEDLFPFNEEPVVRAILRTRQPVLTAIAHTGNLHLADEVADRVAETPSNAAHIFGDIRDESVRRVERLRENLDVRVERVVANRTQRVDVAGASFRRIRDDFITRRPLKLDDLERRLSRHTPAAGLANRAETLADAKVRLRVVSERFVERRSPHVRVCRDRLQTALRDRIAAVERRLSLAAAKLSVLDPHAPLKRGYAMIFEGDRLVNDAGTVAVGTRIRATLARGTLEARVEEVEDD